MRYPKKEKGFTLLELLLAMGIAFLVFLVIYMAYFISQTFFLKGTDTIQEQMYIRTLFSRMGDDLQFLSRLNYLSIEKDELEFEIFNRRVVSTDVITNNKVVEGNLIRFETIESKDFEGVPFLILKKKTEKYEWTQVFGHSQIPNDDADPHGYPDDMRDRTYGKQMMDPEPGTDYDGEFHEVLEQEYGKEFLITKIQFLPYDNVGVIINEGEEYDALRMARSMKIEVDYKLRGRYGESLMERTKVKTAATTIHFINFAIIDQEQQVTSEQSLNVIFPSSASICPALAFCWDIFLCR